MPSVHVYTGTCIWYTVHVYLLQLHLSVIYKEAHNYLFLIFVFIVHVDVFVLQKDSCHLALALGHNSVILWDWKHAQLVEKVSCVESCILYPLLHVQINICHILIILLLVKSWKKNLISVFICQGPNLSVLRKMLQPPCCHL